MSSSNVIRKKKLGRPRIGKKTADVFAIRLPEEIKKAVEAWAKREGIKSRSAAIRRLVERGLERE
jgi:metal-responsive CopG/Arc/MetJ family transcriptional regulator